MYDDQYEEFTQKKMSIIDYVNAYTDEGVTTADEDRKRGSMYINPINATYKDMEVRIAQELDERIVKAVSECVIDVDKDELIKALKYDRDQYSKGYNDALDQIETEIKQLNSRYTVSRERGGMGQVEWSDNLIKEVDILDIIDKYRESEVEQ